MKIDNWPEIGELVMATVTKLLDYGAYVKLDEYDKDGLLHITEISSTWIRNIKDYVRENQKVVLKVLRVDPERKHVDLSLRRVTKREKTEKLLSYKRNKKVESILQTISKDLEIPYDEVYEKTAILIEKKYGDIYSGFEKVAKEGVDVLMEIDVPKELANALAQIVKDKIKVVIVKVKGTLELINTKSNGVLQIKNALNSAKNIEVPKDAEINVYVKAAPKYNIEVSADNYKEAESILKQAVDAAITNIEESGGQGSFIRS